jgi:ribosome-binding factor A
VLSDTLPSLKDPRIGFVTVTGVRERTLEGLTAAHGVLQAEVARALGLRRTPVLSFEYDPAVERGVRLTKMIDELAPEGPDGADGDE